MENENVCPYCGTVIELMSLPRDGECVIECEECGKEFWCEPIVSYYITELKEGFGI